MTLHGLSSTEAVPTTDIFATVDSSNVLSASDTKTNNDTCRGQWATLEGKTCQEASSSATFFSIFTFSYIGSSQSSTTNGKEILSQEVQAKYKTVVRSSQQNSDDDETIARNGRPLAVDRSGNDDGALNSECANGYYERC
jgi:hypothetical protein